MVLLFDLSFRFLNTTPYQSHTHIFIHARTSLLQFYLIKYVIQQSTSSFLDHNLNHIAKIQNFQTNPSFRHLIEHLMCTPKSMKLLILSTAPFSYQYSPAFIQVFQVCFYKYKVSLIPFNKHFECTHNPIISFTLYFTNLMPKSPNFSHIHKHTYIQNLQVNMKIIPLPNINLTNRENSHIQRST